MTAADYDELITCRICALIRAGFDGDALKVAAITDPTCMRLKLLKIALEDAEEQETRTVHWNLLASDDGAFPDEAHSIEKGKAMAKPPRPSPAPCNVPLLHDEALIRPAAPFPDLLAPPPRPPEQRPGPPPPAQSNPRPMPKPMPNQVP